MWLPHRWISSCRTLGPSDILTINLKNSVSNLQFVVECSFLFIFYKMQLNTSLVKGPSVSVPGVPFLLPLFVAVGEAEVLSACVLPPCACLMRGHAGQRGLCFPSCTLPGGREGAQTGCVVTWGTLPSRWACRSEHTLIQYQSWLDHWLDAPCPPWDQEAVILVLPDVLLWSGITIQAVRTSGLCKCRLTSTQKGARRKRWKNAVPDTNMPTIFPQHTF